MVEIFCLVCAEIKDIDLFKTTVKPPTSIYAWDIREVENPNPVPRQRYAPLVRYKSYFCEDMGIGVCYSCSNAIQKIKET